MPTAGRAGLARGVIEAGGSGKPAEDVEVGMGVAVGEKEKAADGESNDVAAAAGKSGAVAASHGVEGKGAMRVAGWEGEGDGDGDGDGDGEGDGVR